MNFKIKIGRKITLFFFFLWMAIKIVFCGLILGLEVIYLIGIDYKIMGIKLSYIIFSITTIIMYYYWIKFIKRKLHFILEGNKKI